MDIERHAQPDVDLSCELPEANSVILDAFGRRAWKQIPIAEEKTEEPKALEVVPNTPIQGQAMAWPAYYKTVSDENLKNPTPRGFGDLAESIENELQLSPLVKVRPELLGMLDRAQQLLDRDPRTNHLQLVVVDGYRKTEVQRRLFLEYKKILAKSHPDKNEYELNILAQQMVSIVPEDLEVLVTSPPPHSTGGAVDVVLVDKSKIDVTSDYWIQNAMVNFGANFDEMMHPQYQDARSATNFYQNGQINEESVLHRRLLYNLMTSLGFTNYPFEFWHYDYGNQFHALCSGGSEAKFGFAAGLNDGRIVEDLSAEKEEYRRYLQIHRLTEETGERYRRHFGLV